MERRYEARLAEMLEDVEVSPEIPEGLLARLRTFVEPFAAALDQPAQRRHALEYLTGLLSKPEHKTGEAIAYLHDQQRQGLRKFIGHVPRGHQPWLAAPDDQVGAELGESDAVIVLDPSGFAEEGVKSVGVARQWCGRLGKVDNRRVGISMAYVSREGHAIVNARLYLPQEWAGDPERRREAGLADYPGRDWMAWHHHQTLLLAAWFLTRETRRGRNPDPGADVTATSAADRGSDRISSRHQQRRFTLSPRYPPATPRRTIAIWLCRKSG
jgi:SRSO17 transposase